MKYIAIKRYKRDGAGGRFNIPYGTTINEVGGILYHNGKAICYDSSAVMRDYFARNDDGRGLERGKLTKAIVGALQTRLDDEGDLDRRWDLCWNDELCMKYRKQAQADFFLWDISFFNAPIEDLNYIAALVGAGKG